MYAIVSIAGQQFKVEKNKKVFVHRLQDKEGSVVELDKVLLIDNDGKVMVGDPYVKNAMVTAKIVSHLKGDKVIVFKKKRKKGFRTLNGHRQYLTELLIDDILESGASKKTTSPKKEKTEEPVKTETAVEETVVATAPETEDVQPKAKKTTSKKSDGDEVKATPTAKKTKAEPKAKAEKKPAAEKKASGTKKSK
ncbi:MAG: 50S ribosomal protein L21 [Bacteroidales bacterium]|nr:50S ribosomal protein L21 [Bacteroidales bacterium]